MLRRSRAEAEAPRGRAGGGDNGNQGRPGPPPLATIRIVGGAPPPAGPAELDYHRGQLVRLRLVSDATVTLQLVGYGLDATVEAGRPRKLGFRARKAGDFPLVVATSHIDVATVTDRSAGCRIRLSQRRPLGVGLGRSRLWRLYGAMRHFRAKRRSDAVAPTCPITTRPRSIVARVR